MKVSFVIPVKASKTTLLECLRSIEQQQRDLIDEVIIVENGSREIFSVACSLPHSILHLPKGNRSRARNVGAKSAKSPIIIFLDADVVLSKGWLSSVLANFSEATLAVQTAIIPATHRDELLQKIRKSRVFFNNQMSFLSINKADPRKVVINSAAFAIKKSVFDLIEGFDEQLIRHEDLDLTQRLLRTQEGEVKGIAATRAYVYFAGSLFDYYCRELKCGTHIVRYHEKWMAGSLWGSFSSLSLNVIGFIRKTLKQIPPDKVAWNIVLLEAVFLFGSFLGIFQRIMIPYKGNSNQLGQIKVKIKIV